VKRYSFLLYVRYSGDPSTADLHWQFIDRKARNAIESKQRRIFRTMLLKSLKKYLVRIVDSRSLKILAVDDK